MGSRFPTPALGPRPAKHRQGEPRPRAPPVALSGSGSGGWGFFEEFLETRGREAGLQPTARLVLVLLDPSSSPRGLFPLENSERM